MRVTIRHLKLLWVTGLDAVCLASLKRGWLEHSGSPGVCVCVLSRSPGACVCVLKVLDYSTGPTLQAFPASLLGQTQHFYSLYLFWNRACSQG